VVNSDLQETVNAARTIESLRLGPRRIAQTDDDIRDWGRVERRTLRLRTVFFGTCEAAYIVPLVLCLLFGGLLVMHGQLSIGAAPPLRSTRSSWCRPSTRCLPADEVQTCIRVTVPRGRRLRGAGGRDDRTDPVRSRLVAERLHFAYDDSADVLHGIDLSPEVGARLAVVGPAEPGRARSHSCSPAFIRRGADSCESAAWNRICCHRIASVARWRS